MFFAMPKLMLDVWSDIACPWCYVGKRRLDTAIERAVLAASIGARERVDDSLDELGQHFLDHEHA